MPTPIYVFEDSQYDRLYPLTYTRPAFALRCGTLTLLERIARVVGKIDGVFVRDVHAAAWASRLGVPVNRPVSTRDGVILINGRWLAMQAGGGAIKWDEPSPDSAALVPGAVAWAHLSAETAGKVDLSRLWDPRTLEAVLPSLHRTTTKATLIGRPWHLLWEQTQALKNDFAFFGPRNEATVLPGAHLLSPENIHLAKGVKIWPGAVLDAQAGPIIVDEDAEIRANAVLTGPLYVGKHALVRTGADIREGTTLGPGSRVGGEVIGSIFIANANKQHHGFVGQSIIGEWANLGAGTTTSNLKNTYGTVRMPVNGIEEETGLMFLGSVVGDHAKIGIGTYLSTGSVIGFGSQVITPRPAKFVPSFAWATASGIARLDFDKLVHLARTVMQRRGLEFTQADHDLFIRIASDAANIEQFEWKGQ